MKGFRPSADNFYTRRRYSIDRSARERDRSSFSRLVYIPRAYYCATVIWPVNRRFRRDLSRRNDLSSSMLRDQFRVFFFFFRRELALCAFRNGRISSERIKEEFVSFLFEASIEFRSILYFPNFNRVVRILEPLLFFDRKKVILRKSPFEYVGIFLRFVSMRFRKNRMR